LLCETILLNDIVVNHVINECPENLIKCKHCKIEIKRKNLKNHEENCEEKILLCLLCEFKYILREKHSDYECK
jgi:hypothetical protein